MTKIKICGLKRIEDIEAANELCPEYIGFVFADFSHRYVDKETAAKLKAHLYPKIQAVGVFVDEDISFVAELLNEKIIDIAQLHGTEDNGYIEELRRLTTGAATVWADSPEADRHGAGKLASDKPRIIKAFNMRKIKDISEIEASSADLVLVDSGTGSGETFDWSSLAEIRRPYLLAGGLGPDNVRSAVESLHPYGVDVSSGVETDKVKDTEKMKNFVSIVRETGAESCSIERETDAESCSIERETDAESCSIERESSAELCSMMREADKDGIYISEAERTDLEEILKLQYLAYQSEAALFKSRDIPPLRQTIEEVEEEFDRGTILKLVEDGRIIGSVRAYEDGGTVYIGKLMVHPDRQKRGYGKKLLSEIEKIYPDKRYELFTSTKSVGNISLYKNCGYEIFDSKVISDELEFIYMEKKGKRK